MPTLSGIPITWSKAFDVPRSSELFLGCASASTSEILKATHRCPATTAVADTPATQLCSIQFGNFKPLPIMPVGFSVVQNPISGYNSGMIDSLPIAMLISGGLMRGHKSVTLNLSYAAPGVALTTIAPSILPDPDTGLYPSGATYKVVADGVTVAESSFVPSATPLSIAVNRTVSNMSITLRTEDGGCIWQNWLPVTGTLQSATPPTFGVLFDVWGGNLIALPTLTTLFGVTVGPIVVTPNFV